jgi:hypothetical protein
MPNLPEIPLFDSVLGLLSALLLLAAVFYLARARSNTATGMTRLRGEMRSQSGREELFAESVPDFTVQRLSFVASMFLHVLLVASLPVMQLLDPGPLLFDIDHYDVVILEYHLPDQPLALPSDLAQSNEAEPEAPAEAESDEALGLPEAENERTQRAEGPMEGPVVAIVSDRERPDPRPLIEFASELDMGPEGLRELPTVPAWSLEKQQAAILALVQVASDEAGPPESAPGDAPALADLGLTEAPELALNPALPAPPGVFSPAGDAWNLVEGSGGLPAPQFGSGLFGEGEGGGGDVVSALALHLALKQGAFGQAFGDRGLLALGGSGEDTPFRTGAADGPEGGGWGRGKLTPVPRKFHGIILVSNSLSTLPEAVGALSGNPVYTVYVDVPDAPRKWILQFCVPQSEAGGVEFSGEVVRVLSRKTVDPPYAHRREPLALEFIPTLERIVRLPQRVVAYATVDQQGVLHNLRMIHGADPQTDSRILASLRAWEFTPAFRDGEPVEVEALFGIPLY